MCKWRATYGSKAFDKGYNFILNLTSIEGLHTKLWVSKVVGVPILGISRLPLGSPGTKWHLGAGPVVKHKIYYKRGRWWLPPSPGCGEFCEFVFARHLFVYQRWSNCGLTNSFSFQCSSLDSQFIKELGGALVHHYSLALLHWSIINPLFIIYSYSFALLLVLCAPSHYYYSIVIISTSSTMFSHVPIGFVVVAPLVFFLFG